METNLRIYASQEYVDGRFEEYGTPEDIVQQVIAAIGTPVFGRVDENKHITLSGHLANGTYTISYEDTDGFTTNVCTIEKGEPEPAYTNILLQAVENDGTLYNGGKGWKDGYRLNSSGTETADAAADVTGFIPVKWGDTLYLSGITMTPNSANPSKTYMYVYSSDYTKLGAYFRGDSTFSHATTNGGIVLDSNGNVKSIEMSANTFTSVPTNVENTAYVRFSCDEITDDAVVTVNESIEGSEGGGSAVTYTNLLPASTDNDFTTVYNGVGYKSGVRWSASSGVEKDLEGSYLSGWIPCKQGDIIYVKNVTMNKNDGTNAYTCAIYWGDGDTIIGTASTPNALDQYCSPVWDESGQLIQATASFAAPTHFRIGASYIGADSIVTVNQPIQ